MVDKPMSTNALKTKPRETSLSLTEAQRLACMQQGSPATSREALGRLLETARFALESFDENQLLTTQASLEDALIRTLIAMKSLNIQPEQALGRALDRMKAGNPQGAFHIYADRVEIKAQGEIRGEWILYSQSDYEAALHLARELGCAVIHEESCQLGLFQHVRLHQAGQLNLI
jgi:hypothetical protein